MEKLERILHAEDHARDHVQESRERAVEIEREASVLAVRIRQETLAAAREEARTAAATIIDKVRAESIELERRSAEDRAAFIDRASARIPGAVTSVLRELAG
ncbi:MAG: hypothetical protein RBS17_08450 [Coriobacteriia bacterium]|nr:hypothetical protein [Coriobacteriia bacterium]